MAGTTKHRGRMHPDTPQTDFTRDPILDGRDSLRLVKLRLALTLITVAILPIAAVSPLVRAAAEEARVAHHQRLESEASQVTTTFDREVHGVQTMSASLLAHPRVLAPSPPGPAGPGAGHRARGGTRLGRPRCSRSRRAARLERGRQRADPARGAAGPGDRGTRRAHCAPGRVPPLDGPQHSPTRRPAGGV